MNLKNACFITLVIALTSILLTIGGYVIFYATLFIEHFNIPNLINAVVAILVLLLESGGFIIFLMAMMNRLRNPDANTGTLFVLAAILILLGALIGIGTSLIHAVGIYRYFAILRFMFYMGLYLFGFLAHLCLGILALTQSSAASSGKSPAALALACFLVLFSLSIVNHAICFQQSFQDENLIRTVGFILMSLGGITNRVAVIFFLLMFLKHRPWPPMATVEDLPPEPLPTLSAEVDLPE